eukprot:TRINITY_DN4270_c0_g1_i1.p1 TRINITY_DN4270_c0_g1~~TRINITY_DN4270_c0_g1_i1.p1  ORF type:complete len:528 (-),score=154.41 TRINITY_DN4270_c0_g1_i1:409-1965(-)
MAEKLYEVLLTLFGDDPMTLDDARGWLQQGFKFHNPSSSESAALPAAAAAAANITFGLSQKYGGPCGVLAAVQGFLLVKLIQEDEVKKSFDSDHKSSGSSSLPINPTEEQARNALVWALATILDRARTAPSTGRAVDFSKKKFILALSTLDMFPIAESVIEVDSFGEVERAILENIRYFESDIGVLLFVVSIMLTRGMEQVQADRDDNSQPLVQKFGHSSQDLVNLCLCGKAVSNVHDGDKYLGDDPNPDPSAFALKGIPSEVPVGFLTSLEALRYSKVGSYYKNPLNPVWVIGSPSHYTVMFGLDKSICSMSDSEKKEQKIREVFNQLDPQELGFVPLERLSDLISKLDLDVESQMKLRNRLDPDGMGIVIWTDFWSGFQAVQSASKSPPVVVQAPKEWSCPICTYTNNAARGRCEICDSVRPTTPAPTPPPPAAVAPPQEPEKKLSNFVLWHYNGISNSKVDFARCVKVLVSLSDLDMSKFNQGAVDEPGLREVVQTRWSNALVDYGEAVKPPKIT